MAPEIEVRRDRKQTALTEDWRAVDIFQIASRLHRGGHLRHQSLYPTPPLELVSASQERQMGLQAYTQVLNDPKVSISNDPREDEAVERVVARIIEAAEASQYAETARPFE